MNSIHHDQGPQPALPESLALVRALRLQAWILGSLGAITLIGFLAVTIAIAAQPRPNPPAPPLPLELTASPAPPSPRTAAPEQANEPPCPTAAPSSFVAQLWSARVRPIEEDGKRIGALRSLDSWLKRGSTQTTPLLVLMGRTDCGPCKEQAAAVSELVRRNQGKLTVVGLLLEEASKSALEAFRRSFATEGIPYAFWAKGEGSIPGSVVPLSLWLVPGTDAMLCQGAIYRRTTQGDALESWLARVQ